MRSHCGWLKTSSRFSFYQPNRSKENKLSAHANKSLQSCCRPTFDPLLCGERVVRDEEQLQHWKRSHCRWLDTWRWFFVSQTKPFGRKKVNRTRQYFSSRLLQAYIRLQVMWKKSHAWQEATGTLAKNQSQVARHVKAIFNLTIRSQKTHLQTLIILSWVVEGSDSDATEVIWASQERKNFFNTRKQIIAGG